jgi:hypothetical protein
MVHSGHKYKAKLIGVGETVKNARKVFEFKTSHI